MKVLMAGLGSIGQRHLRNMKKIYGGEVEVSAYRVRRLRSAFDDRMQVRDGVDLEEEFHIQVFSDLEEALAKGPDAVFITTITSRHMECALKAARAGCDIFLEKPLSCSMDGVDELLRTVEGKGLILYMGYQNRFHPCVQEAREFLRERRIGRLVSVDSEFGERLTTMHAYEDYRGTYMARREMGGGPVLNLQIHCLDYLQWLLGEPVSAYCLAGNRSSLDIDVEDHALSLYEFRQDDGSLLPAYAHADFLQYPPVHKLKLVGEKGRIELDLNRAVTGLIVDGAPAEEITHPDFERNDMFQQELRGFMKCIKDRIQPEPGLRQGIMGLKMALAARKSAEEGRRVMMEEIR